MVGGQGSTPHRLAGITEVERRGVNVVTVGICEGNIEMGAALLRRRPSFKLPSAVQLSDLTAFHQFPV